MYELFGLIQTFLYLLNFVQALKPLFFIYVVMSFLYLLCFSKCH